ncbi:hypothetical protein [Lachnoclostridium sp. Marseille-P6806]|uniref:hypothetical protein n=1 Tax=Lachnoclostridium sp. Marseille-P6806 TaxID=2364793 RepID=UPI001031D2B5|nr:hypothetical protein [Lachnoclostridium sp. Marseille-P6806]
MRFGKKKNRQEENISAATASPGTALPAAELSRENADAGVKYSVMHDVSSFRTALFGYDKRAVKAYLQTLVQGQADKEASLNHIIDELRTRNRSLSEDNELSIRKYNQLVKDWDELSEEAKQVPGLKEQAEAARREYEALREENESLRRSAEESAAQSTASKEAGAALREARTDGAEPFFVWHGEEEKQEQEKREREKPAENPQNLRFTELLEREHAASRQLEEAVREKDTEIRTLQEELFSLRTELGLVQSRFDSVRMKADSEAREKDSAIEFLRSRVSLFSKKARDYEDAMSADEMKKLRALLEEARGQMTALAAEQKLSDDRIRVLTEKNENLREENSMLSVAAEQMTAASKQDKSYISMLEREMKEMYEDKLGMIRKLSELRRKEEETSAGQAKREAGDEKESMVFVS